jgi:heterodisulfide reductase subunit C
MALRSLSQRLGYFAESEKGRQQFALNKMLGTNILKYGYCVYPRTFHYDMFPEAGKVWKWQEKHLEDVYARLGANLDGEGPGPLRKIPKEDLDDLKKIFDRTGATAIMDKINKVSKYLRKRKRTI